MNDCKICFIMCVNSDAYEREALGYISRLAVPEGMETEVLTVREAASMTSGYNEAMNASDAKYKVYLHQDVFLLNKHFISELLSVFADSLVGMVGMIGSPVLPGNCVMWTSDRVGCLYNETGISLIDRGEKPYTEVEAIDGLLMATQYDIPWREDLFKGWDFYDISQSAEFRRQGLKVVVPHMDEPWCLHDDEYMNLDNYFKWRDVFASEYRGDVADMLRDGGDISSGTYTWTYEGYREVVLDNRQMAEMYIDRLNRCLQSGTVRAVIDFIDIMNEPEIKEHYLTERKEIAYAYIFAAIAVEELRNKSGSLFLLNATDITGLIGIFKELEFSLCELEFVGDEDAKKRVSGVINRYNITKEALECTVTYSSKHKDEVREICLFL